jgi:hypothetical protein
MQEIWVAARKVSRQTPFVVVVLVLLIAAVSLNGAAQFLKLHFKKLPVPLAKPLDSIPVMLGPWVCVSKDEQLASDLEQTLQTDVFVFRDYVNSAVVPAARIAEFEGKSHDARLALLGKLRHENPDVVVNLAVTYYTGKADTVAHIPERCYVADGYEASDWEFPVWDVNSTRSKLPNGQVEVKFINFEDQTGVSQVTKSVAYFFHCNGNYQSDPLRVRASLQNLLEKYGYYAKVELMTTESNREKSAAVMKDFLRSALPEIEKTLPDWNSLPH